MAEQIATPLAVAASATQAMVGVAFQTYQMNDGTQYVADAAGVVAVQPRHVSAMIVSGCAFKASGLPS
jgi:hypothetical protein